MCGRFGGWRLFWYVDAAAAKVFVACSSVLSYLNEQQMPLKPLKLDVSLLWDL